MFTNLNSEIGEISQSIRWDDIQSESADLLRQLIRIDTTNPPGNENEAARLLKSFFDNEGIPSEIVESQKNRANVIADIPGREERTLILLSHTDVVPADPKKWSHKPFSGDADKEYIWGRGAIDCKGFAASGALVLALIKRLKIQLRNSIKFISTADEEMGGHFGAEYIVKNNINKNGKNYIGLINEGGIGVILGGKKLFLPCFGEKGPLWLKIIAKGKPGHASMPHNDNPNLILLDTLRKVCHMKPERRIVPNLAKSLETYIPTEIKNGSLLKIAIKGIFLLPNSHKILAEILDRILRKEKVKAMIKNTVCLTMIKSGYKENVIPEEAEATLDIRLLPGTSPYNFVEEIKKHLKDERIKVEIDKVYEPSESDPNSEFLMKIRNLTKKLYPDIPFIPTLATGFTDSRYFRAIGIQSYGFIPWFLTEEEISTIHGIDERISLQNLKEGIRTLFEIVTAIAM